MSSQAETARNEQASAIRLLPSAGVLPANILRLHIAFEAAPDVELAASSARLLDASGAEVRHAFLDLAGGLWSADGRRLTLILHPGRIKSGLAGNRDAGPAMAVGRSYSVEIDGGDGPVRLPLIVGPAVTTAIDPGRWRVAAAEAGDLGPLMVCFDRVMDSVSVKTALGVLDSAGDRIAGAWRISEDGREGRFDPLARWSANHATLDLAPDLEDVAGNRPFVSFEMNVG
jgi:hypothetical protein